MAPYKWTPYRDELLRKLYSEGVAVEEIGRLLGSTGGGVRTRAHVIGLSRKAERRFWNRERLKIFVREYPRCEDPWELAERLGTTVRSLRALANKEGIRRRFWAKPKEPN